jgi:hypothetical protein
MVRKMANLPGLQGLQGMPAMPQTERDASGEGQAIVTGNWLLDSLLKPGSSTSSTTLGFLE